MSFGYVSFGEMLFGVMSFGVMSFGVMSFGVRSFGVMSFGLLSDCRCITATPTDTQPALHTHSHPNRYTAIPTHTLPA